MSQLQNAYYWTPNIVDKPKMTLEESNGEVHFALSFTLLVRARSAHAHIWACTKMALPGIRISECGGSDRENLSISGMDRSLN